MTTMRTSIEADDFDVYTAWDFETGFESKRVQLSPGQGWFRLDSVILEDLLVWRHQTSHRLFAEIAAPSGIMEFIIGRFPENTIWCGLELPELALFVHRQNQSYSATTPANGEFYGFTLSEQTARDWRLVPETFYARTQTPENAAIPLTPTLVGNFLHQVDVLLNQSDNLFVSENMAAWYEREAIISGLQKILNVCFDKEASPKRLRQLSRQKLINNARNLISSRLDEPLSSSDIARILGTSRRSLERGFQDIYSISPYQYLLVQKMHAVRAMLKRGEGSVLEACTQQGFENAGRFAGMYARHFGELPSQTLDKSSTRKHEISPDANAHTCHIHLNNTAVITRQ